MNGILSVRSYDAEEICFEDLGAVSKNGNVAPILERALADPRRRYINIHTARSGCLLTAVEEL